MLQEFLEHMGNKFPNLVELARDDIETFTYFVNYQLFNDVIMTEEVRKFYTQFLALVEGSN